MMTTELAWKAARSKALPLMEAYQTDLDIDESWIMRSSAPWIHYTRRTNTFLIHLEPHDSTAWPAKDEVVKILFGHGTRWRVLENTLQMAVHFRDTRGEEPPALVQYWNGRRLREISRYDAHDIVLAHVDRVTRAWRRQEVGVAA